MCDNSEVTNKWRTKKKFNWNNEVRLSAHSIINDSRSYGKRKACRVFRVLWSLLFYAWIKSLWWTMFGFEHYFLCFIQNCTQKQNNEHKKREFVVYSTVKNEDVVSNVGAKSHQKMFSEQGKCMSRAIRSRFTFLR